MVESSQAVVSDFRQKVEELLGPLKSDGPIDGSVLSSVHGALLDEAEATARRLEEEWAVIDKDVRVRERDASTHLELMNIKHDQLMGQHDKLRKAFAGATQINAESTKKIDVLETQLRATTLELRTCTQQLRHTEKSLKERTEAYVALKRQMPEAASIVEGPTPEPTEFVHLIDDTCEDLLDKLAGEKSPEEEMLAMIRDLRKKLSSAQKKFETAEESKNIALGKVGDLQSQLEAAKEELSKQTTTLVLSPRSTDIQELRRRFQDADIAIRTKDEEINELHRLLFELRPKLEREVEDQVKGILETAEKDAQQIRNEAQKFYDSQAQRIEGQLRELERSKQEIEVLRAAVKHRDELLEQHAKMKEDNAQLSLRVSQLESKQMGRGNGDVGHKTEPTRRWKQLSMRALSILAMATAPVLAMLLGYSLHSNPAIQQLRHKGVMAMLSAWADPGAKAEL